MIAARVFAGVAAASCGAAALTVHAQTQPLDLRGAVHYALEHNADIASRRATLANDEAQYAKDHANEFPPVTGLLQNQIQRQSNGSSGSLAQFGFGTTGFSTFSQNTAQLGTQWTIYNGSYNQILAQQAKRQADSAREDVQRAEQRLAQDVSNAYFAVSVRRETVRLDAADRVYQQALLGVAQNNERVGRAAGVDVLRSQVNALRADAVLATAQSDEATASESLAQAIGAPPEQAFQFVEVLPEPALPSIPPTDLVATAQAHRSDIASAAAALAKARLANSIIDTDRFPSLQINAAFGNQFSPSQGSIPLGTGLGTVGPIAATPAPAGARGNPGFWQIGATETLQIGFIDYGSRHAQHRAARIAIDAAQTNLDVARYNVETDVRQALRQAQTAAGNLATAKRASALGAESARIAQLQYKNGLISLTDATQAERDNLSAQNDLVNARVTYINAIVHVRVATGSADPLAVVDLRTP